MENNKIDKGDKIRVGGLVTVVEEVVELLGQKMLRTPYGDFNIDIVVKIKED